MSDAFTVKVYTRRQITSWVESETKYKFDQLRNGVFFCNILSIIFPEDSLKGRYNQKPVGQYQYTNNLILMKRVLDKHGLQTNLNINNILASKNCFELVNWMRNLYDYRGKISPLKMKSPDKEIRHAISPKNRNQNEAKKRFSEMVPMKKTETGAILPKVKPLSNNFFPEATERELKLRWTAHRRVRSKIEESSFMGELQNTKLALKEPPQLDKDLQNNGFESYIRAHTKPEQIMDLDLDQRDTIYQENEEWTIDNEALRKQALQESIQSLTKILLRIASAVKSDAATITEYKQKIRLAMFSRQIP